METNAFDIALDNVVGKLHGISECEHPNTSPLVVKQWNTVRCSNYPKVPMISGHVIICQHLYMYNVVHMTIMSNTCIIYCGNINTMPIYIGLVVA